MKLTSDYIGILSILLLCLLGTDELITALSGVQRTCDPFRQLIRCSLTLPFNILYTCDLTELHFEPELNLPSAHDMLPSIALLSSTAQTYLCRHLGYHFGRSVNFRITPGIYFTRTSVFLYCALKFINCKGYF